MDKVNKVLTRGVAKILPSKNGLSELLRRKKIRLYQGFDPTGRLHLGHAVGLRKLMAFADLGHEVIFLFGTGTVLVGDPSQRAFSRKQITEAEIEKNISGWKNQVTPFVDFKKVKVKKNGDWLNKMTLRDIISVASKISAVQLIKRDSFQKRLAMGDTVWYHETMYPILQGYDSVVMDVDLELGGTDQEFNMLVGRELQKKINKKEKFVLTLPMILGTDGKQMSKTSGNCIWLDDSASDMFGKLMSIPDAQLDLYIEVLTSLPLDTAKKEGPLNAKKKLALAVVTQAHGEDKARIASSSFEKTFQKGKPNYIRHEVKILTLIDLVSDFSESKSDAKRKIEQGGVDIDGKVTTNPTVKLKSGQKVKIGKKTFIEILIKK